MLYSNNATLGIPAKLDNMVKGHKAQLLNIYTSLNIQLNKLTIVICLNKQ